MMRIVYNFWVLPVEEVQDRSWPSVKGMTYLKISSWTTVRHVNPWETAGNSLTVRLSR